MAVAGEKADRLLVLGSVFSYSPVDVLCCEGLWEFASTAVAADATPRGPGITWPSYPCSGENYRGMNGCGRRKSGQAAITG
jgi:hypothetical protein